MRICGQLLNEMFLRAVRLKGCSFWRPLVLPKPLRSPLCLWPSEPSRLCSSKATDKHFPGETLPSDPRAHAPSHTWALCTVRRWMRLFFSACSKQPACLCSFSVALYVLQRKAPSKTSMPHPAHIRAASAYRLLMKHIIKGRLVSSVACFSHQESWALGIEPA